MRKITEQAVDAFVNNYRFSSGNTKVVASGAETAEWMLFLHNNLIAEKDVQNNILRIYDGGWESVTTKERLNGLLSRMAPDYGIIQRDHVWYLVDNKGMMQEWTGRAKFHAGQYKGNA